MILESDNFAEEHTKLSLSVLTHDYDFEPSRSLYYLGILLKRPMLTRKYLKSGSNTHQPPSSITPEIFRIFGGLFVDGRSPAMPAPIRMMKKESNWRKYRGEQFRLPTEATLECSLKDLRGELETPRAAHILWPLDSFPNSNLAIRQNMIACKILNLSNL